MRLVAMLAVLVAACGGKSAPAPAKDPEQAQIERDLAELRAFADRACACTDRACTDAIDKEMADEFRTAELDQTSGGTTPEQDQQIERDLVRLLQCIRAQGTEPESLGVIAVRMFDAIRAEICACQDPDCARSAIAAWDDAFRKYRQYPVSDADQKDFEQRIVPEATACFQKGHALITEESVLELKAIRKAACACKDAECASQNRAEFEAWKVKHEKTAADTSTQEEIGTVAMEMAICQRDASSEAAQQAVLELTALRDAACACTTPACADEVQAAFDEYLMTYRDVRGSPESSERVGELAGEMSACLATARGE